MQHYPIRAVAQMTGLSIDTLRAWERRYGAVTPDRNDRGRLYSDADVARLRQLGELVSRGHAIGTIAGLPDHQLGDLLAGTHALTARPAEPFAPVNLEALTAALDGYDLDTIEAGLNRHAAVLSPRGLIFAVILPLLRDVGQRWEAGTLRAAQEHLISAIVRSVLGGLLRAVARPDATPKVVFAAPAGERHELGLLCAALLAASAGYGVVYLGPDLPATDVVHAATTAGARVAMVSATTPRSLDEADARTLGRLPPGVELWVGGPEAPRLSAAVQGPVRPVDALESVVGMLARHAH